MVLCEHLLQWMGLMRNLVTIGGQHEIYPMAYNNVANRSIVAVRESVMGPGRGPPSQPTRTHAALSNSRCEPNIHNNRRNQPVKRYY